MIKDNVRKYLTSNGFGEFCPKAVLFDMDGVLYDSMPHHAIAWRESMARFGIHMTEADAYATEGARGIDTIVRFVKEQQGKDITLEEAQRMYDVKAELFHQMSEAKVFDGAKELMARIVEREWRVAVVTGSGQRPLIDRLLQDFGDYVTEDHIVTAYDVTHGKPNPEPYQIGLRKVGNLKPWEGIVVENAPLGIQAGVAAKIFTVAINSGPLPDQDLLDSGANLLYPSLVDFLAQWQDIPMRQILG